MKNLFSLALKYMRRQPMRTALMFLSVTVAVFCFQLLCFSALVARDLTISMQERRQGSWEADLGAWYEKAPDKAKMLGQVRGSEDISDYCYFDLRTLPARYERDEQGRIIYFDVELNGESFDRYRAVSQNSFMGDRSLIFGEQNDRLALYSDLAEDEIVLPSKCADSGIAPGDTVTLSVTPSAGLVTDETLLGMDFIQKAFEGREIGEGRPLFSDSPGAAESSPVIKMNLLSFLSSQAATGVHEASWRNLEFEDIERAGTVSREFKVAGFADLQGTSTEQMFTFITGPQTDTAVPAAISESLAERSAEWFETDSESGADPRLAVRITRGLPFDETLENLHATFGLPEDEAYEDLHPDNPDSLYNTDLLSKELRGGEAIVQWLSGPNLIILIFGLAAVFLIWLLMRFVIDNAFDISVQERMDQITTLRVMGASRRQVFALVGAEAFCYCVAAIPLGYFGAALCRTFAERKLAALGLGITRHPLPAVSWIGILLAIFAVFFSAYTAAAKASKSFSPLETRRKGSFESGRKERFWQKDLSAKKYTPEADKKAPKKPRKPEKSEKSGRKAKLFRTNRSFLRYYTFRSMRRTRSRFLISVITLTAGSLLFCFGICVGGLLLADLAEGSDLFSQKSLLNGADIQMTVSSVGYDGATERELAESFSENPRYAAANIQAVSSGQGYVARDEISQMLSGSPDILAAVTDSMDQQSGGASPEGKYDFTLRLIDRAFWESAPLTEESAGTLAEITGLSYEEFLELKGGLFAADACKPGSENGKYVYKRAYEDSYTPVPAQNGDLPVLSGPGGEELPVAGVLMRPALPQSLSGREWSASAELFLPKEAASSGPISETDYQYTANLLLSSSADYLPALEEIDTLTSKLWEIPNVTGVNIDKQLFYEHTGFSTLLGAILTLCAVALLAVWLTGIFTMINTVNASVLNRSSELTMMWQVGMSARQMRVAVSMESLSYCAISGIFGAVLGAAAAMFFGSATSILTARPMLMFLLALAAALFTLIVNCAVAVLGALPSLHSLRNKIARGARME